MEDTKLILTYIKNNNLQLLKEMVIYSSGHINRELFQDAVILASAMRNKKELLDTLFSWISPDHEGVYREYIQSLLISLEKCENVYKRIVDGPGQQPPPKKY